MRVPWGLPGREGRGSRGADLRGFRPRREGPACWHDFASRGRRSRPRSASLAPATQSPAKHGREARRPRLRPSAAPAGRMPGLPGESGEPQRAGGTGRDRHVAHVVLCVGRGASLLTTKEADANQPRGNYLLVCFPNPQNPPEGKGPVVSKQAPSLARARLRVPHSRYQKCLSSHPAGRPAATPTLV